tara:strand:+ start:996 stop:2048 length:1053 start_codon:yes stop_codon:yes gene_type:complete
MSEDIFSQFFNLFNNEESGVNWELAKQINNHITKDEAVLPLELSNNEINFEQIFRVIELKSDDLSSFETSPKEIRLMTPREYGLWFIDSIKHFDFESIESPELSMFGGIGGSNMKSSILGMQFGNLAGLLGKFSWGLSQFGIILPRSNTLAINHKTFSAKVNNFEASENDLSLAYFTVEYVALCLGKFSQPFENIMNTIARSSEDMINKIKDLNLDMGPEAINNPEEMFSNISGVEGIDPNQIFESIAAPLSFCRSVIKQKSKELNLLQDNSIFDLLMDLSFSNYESPTKDIETKISELDYYSDSFLDYIKDSQATFTLNDILGSTELIPTLDELYDPISWAARTSLPPI